MIHQGDALEVLRTLPDASVQCCVTSPPYWGLRDYGHAGQLGLERTPDQYVSKMVAVFEEVRRVLMTDGVCWLNLGDCYATGAGAVGAHPGGGEQGERWKGSRGSRKASGKHVADGSGVGPMTQPNRMPLPGLKPKDLVGIPWMVAFALRADGWWLRQGIVWSKPNPMPESVGDRCTQSHEFVFLLSKSERYFYDADAIKEPGTYAGPNGSQLSPYAQGFKRRTKSEEAERQDKQRGHSRRHAGFNDRWDAMERSEQTGVMRNKRSVWTIAPKHFAGAHFAVMPEELALTCVRAGSRYGDTVLDPFAGSGTVGVVCERTGRKFIGCELNPAYVEMAEARIRNVAPLFSQEIA